MADDKLKTSPEPPGPDRFNDVPAENAPPLQKLQAQEASEPEKNKGLPSLVWARHPRRINLLSLKWRRTIRLTSLRVR